MATTPRCPECERPLTLDAKGVPVYACHPCQRAWPTSYFTHHNDGTDPLTEHGDQRQP